MLPRCLGPCVRLAKRLTLGPEWSGHGSHPVRGPALTGDPSPRGQVAALQGPGSVLHFPQPLWTPRFLRFLTGHFVPGQDPSLGVWTSGPSLSPAGGCVSLRWGLMERGLSVLDWAACCCWVVRFFFLHVLGTEPLSDASLAKNARALEMNCMLFLF